jgi:hypothetical protein
MREEELWHILKGAEEEVGGKLLFVMGFPNLDAETGILENVRYKEGENLCECSRFISTFKAK